MTNQERLRAIFGNLKNFTWEVNPTYTINEQDAFVLREMYAEYLSYKMQNEKMKRYNRNIEENRANARERYTKKKGEIAK